MHPSHVWIDEETLKGLYVDQRLTAIVIAARIGCGPTTVFRRLRDFGIAIRPRGLSSRSEVKWQSPSAFWSSEKAYAVGLIATDGNLSTDGRHMSVTSKDLDLLEALRRCLQLQTPISKTRNSTGKVYHRVQWGDRGLYDWLLAIGLTPAKSLTLGALTVPKEYFVDFFRGCIDGDGSVLVYTDRYHMVKNERYQYERLYVNLVSASRPFLDWIQEEVRCLAGVNGVIEAKREPGRRTIWLLRYAKRESIRLLRWMYYAPDLPCLSRKREKAEQFLSRGF
ncbi:MAG: LAGLIDADG family homing endonuclease [Candidatus Rokuibacteriota bacterium]